MSYATPLDMLERISPDLLAQVAIPAPHRISVPLMESAIRNDLADFSADEQAIAAKAMTALNRALEDAKELIDFWLRKRHPLPLVSVPSLVLQLNVRIAYFKLFRKPSEEVQADFKSCMQVLEAESRGTGDLGISPPAPSGAGDVWVASSFEGADMRGYG